jgi:hypothetical protein
MVRRFGGSLLLLAVCALGALGNDGAHAQPAAPISFGKSVVPLNGPWKFQIGDSPSDPRTGEPLWSEPGFDDSHWETVDLTPRAGIVRSPLLSFAICHHMIPPTKAKRTTIQQIKRVFFVIAPLQSPRYNQ